MNPKPHDVNEINSKAPIVKIDEEDDFFRYEWVIYLTLICVA